MIRTVGLLCFWLLAISGPALARPCIVPFIRTLDNQTAQGNMYATSGKRCSIILLRSRGPMNMSAPSSAPWRIENGAAPRSTAT